MLQPAHNTAPGGDNYLRDLLVIYFAQQRLILFIAAIVFCASAAAAFLAAPIYSAEGSILVRAVEPQRSPQSLQDEDIRSFKVAEEDLLSERELLRSPAVIEGAIDRLTADGRLEPASVDPERVRKELRVMLVPDSRVIEVELRGDDPSRTVVLLDALLEQYVSQRGKILYPAETLNFFTDQLELFEAQLEEAEDGLILLAESNQAPNPEASIENNLLSRQRLEERLGKLAAEEAELAERIRHLTTVLADRESIRHFSFIDSGPIATLATRLVDLRMERGKAARHYDEGAKAVRVVDQQIATTLAQLRREVQDYHDHLASKLAGVVAAKREISAQIDAIDSANVELYRQSVESDRLNREAQLLRDSYATFLRRRAEAQINTSVDKYLSLFFVGILTPAHTSGEPVSPNRPMLLVIGLMSGLLTGFSLGFLREFFDHSFRLPRDVEESTGLTVLFSIPIIRRGGAAEPDWDVPEPEPEPEPADQGRPPPPAPV